MKNFLRTTFAIIALALAAGSALAQVQPKNLTIQQRNAADTGYITRALATPAAGANGVLYYNGATELPEYFTIGAGLSISSGVLSASGGVAQVNADWNAVTGLARILNKPAISMVGMTGNYGDLLAVPTFSMVATSGAYADLSGRPTLATVATTGNYNDLANKPTIPTVTAFNYGAPASRTLAVATAYQASDPSKAAIVTVSPQCTASISLTTGTTCIMQARIGTIGLNCSTGTVVATWTNGNTGTLTVGLALNQIIGAPGDIKLPIGGYFALCATSGTFTINTAVDQSAG